MSTTMAAAAAAYTPALPAGGIFGCTPFILPAHGVLSVWGAEPTELAFDGLFQPHCTTEHARREAAIVVSTNAAAQPEGLSDDASGITHIDGSDAFNASIFPQCYALAATTVLAYVLLIMLLIVPRSFLDGGIVVLGRRGFTNGPSHGISIGGRPWLQKVATLSVTIALTIATVDTFRVAERQYNQGTQNANELQREVLGGMQIKIIQLVSDTFLWLAQAQTLIRLFPRQREKIIIKWTAFSLILLDVTFGALNSFKYMGVGVVARPLNFTQPVAALSYLFQLSLGLLYAAWVIYYSLMKKRYAFYHPLMKNISLMAILSIVQPDFTGWGEYVRWVGAAAASVVVWEWVERIEALEREEKKDGILGREVFDGDEMMDTAPSDLHSWHRSRRNSKKRPKSGGDGGESGTGNSTSISTSSGTPSRTWPAMSSIANRHVNDRHHRPHGGTSEAQPNLNSTPQAKSKKRFPHPPFWPSRPAPAVTPVSRTDTASADSTVYAVRYQPLSETSAGLPHQDRPYSVGETGSSPLGRNITDRSEDSPSPTNNSPTNNQNVAITDAAEPSAEEAGPSGSPHWYSVRRLGLLRVASRGPPAEVLPHTAPRQTQNRRRSQSAGRWDVKGRWDDFAANHAEKVLERIRGTPDVDGLPVTTIPAPPRPGAALARLLEEEEGNGSSPTEVASSAVPTQCFRSTGDTSSAIPLTPILQRHPSVSAASRHPPTPSDAAGPSYLRSAAIGGDGANRMTTSRRPVVRYESLPVLPSSGAHRDELHASDGHLQHRTDPQPPP
ncbi:PalH/RIM21-domain-containing protein [Microdochium bolleyi]|uniref:PalH/RIM21-domain-containing protein n=1 Tax=Microdochium bolleyi TaxID=196109 RepID=A0A136JAX4_9PEZI|nr:PalH/RIM21-domain-containing protein [Microdochium bolleyi]